MLYLSTSKISHIVIFIAKFCLSQIVIFQKKKKQRKIFSNKEIHICHAVYQSFIKNLKNNEMFEKHPEVIDQNFISKTEKYSVSHRWQSKKWFH